MKHPELIVQIPEPCHENWSNMSPTEKGKFCNVCTKEVIDFTSDSDEEIIKYLSNHESTCGRFHPSQLNRKLIADRKKRNHWLSYAATFLLPITLFSQETKTPELKNTDTEQIDTSAFKSLKISSLDRKAKLNSTKQNDSITVQGIITDESGFPLPGATVQIKGTNIGAATDFDGHYSIKSNYGSILVISYVGYEIKKIKITSSTINVQLESGVQGLHFVGAVVTESPNERYKSKFTKKSQSKTVEKLNEREQTTRNYFAFQRKKWLEKRAKRRAERAARKAERLTTKK
ncbi:carboxypeptidase-like regulatory domain-containing protein [Kordia sp.]|uniref:carboxypeptidase-like regulatory domain-containing protein n=1 Tax=Kordia sp. TaxID=1965332 RepID=UPI003D6B34A5